MSSLWQNQIRDIIATATKNQTDFQQLLFEADNHLIRLGAPKFLKDKVKLWLTYTWEQQKTLGMHVFSWVLSLNTEYSHC